MNIFKSIIKKETTDSRSFLFQKNNSTLTFALRIGSKREWKDFKDLLLEAAETVQKEIDKK
jgi:hypothetical protein